MPGSGDGHRHLQEPLARGETLSRGAARCRPQRGTREQPMGKLRHGEWGGSGVFLASSSPCPPLCFPTGGELVPRLCLPRAAAAHGRALLRQGARHGKEVPKMAPSPMHPLALSPAPLAGCRGARPHGGHTSPSHPISPRFDAASSPPSLAVSRHPGSRTCLPGSRNVSGASSSAPRSGSATSSTSKNPIPERATLCLPHPVPPPGRSACNKHPCNVPGVILVPASPCAALSPHRAPPGSGDGPWGLAVPPTLHPPCPAKGLPGWGTPRGVGPCPRGEPEMPPSAYGR